MLAFAVIFVIIDLMEKLDDFIDQDVPYDIILNYYFVFIPEMMRLMLPVAVLLSGLFITGKLSNLNEITAIKAGGVSLYRYLAPFLITGFLISLFSVYFGGYVVPLANKQKVFIEQNYMKKGLVPTGSNIHFQDNPNRIVTIAYFDVRTKQANNVSIEDFDPDNSTIMTKRIDASRMKYDEDAEHWRVFKGTIRHFGENSETLEKFDKLFVDNLNFMPDDVIKKQRKPEELNLTELNAYSIEQQQTGNNPTRIQIEFHSRIAFAFASFIVVLFGIPISVNKRRGGIALQFGISLLITFVYLVFMKISQAFGKNGVLDPVLTAWLANIVFLILALLNLFRARK